MLRGKFHDGLHIAGDTSVMHHHDGTGFFSDQTGKGAGINIGVQRVAVGKHDFCAPQREGVGRGDKRIGRHDYLVSRSDTEHQRSQFKCICTAGGKQGLAKTIPLFEKTLA